LRDRDVKTSEQPVVKVKTRSTAPQSAGYVARTPSSQRRRDHASPKSEDVEPAVTFTTGCQGARVLAVPGFLPRELPQRPVDQLLELLT